MGLLDSLTNFFSSSKASGVEGKKIIPTGYEATSVGFSNSSDSKTKEYLEQMKGWVGACVTAISDQVATIDLKLYQYTKNNVEEVTEHPILDLLFRVNSFTTKFDHFWLTQSYLELTGEAPWFLESDGKNVTNIFFLRPDRIKPMIGKSRMIEGYEYEVAPGEKIKLENEEVLFLKYPNPSKPFRGIGTLQMASLTVDVDNYSEQWNKDFYQNSARPDSIIKVNTPNMDDEQKKRLKASFEKSYRGKENAHKTLLLFGDMTFDKAGFNQRDMDFLEQQRFSRDKILGIFRVPKAIVAQTEGVNYASAKTAEYVFAKYVIKPKMERMVQQLNEFLLPLFEDSENMFIDFESPVPSDMEEKIKRYDSALGKGWMTINEVREEQGLEAVEGGDVLYVSSNLSTLERVQEGAPTTLSVKRKSTSKYNRIVETKVRGKKYFERQKTEKTTKALIKQTLIDEIKSKKQLDIIKKQQQEEEDSALDVVWPVEKQDAYWTQKNLVFKKHHPEVAKAFVEIFKKQRKSTLIKLAKKSEMSDDFFNDIKLDVDKEAEKALTIVLPVIEELFLEAGAETYEAMELQSQLELTEEIRKTLTTSVREMAKGVTETTNKFIQDAVVEGLKEGESVAIMRERIVNVFDQAESFRADRIARTEAVRYNTRASEQAFVDSGLVEAKIWKVDGNPCPFCLELSGKTAPLGQNFLSKGDTLTTSEGDSRVIDYEDLPAPPLHPNCQCDIVPIFKGNKSARKNKYQHSKKKVKKSNPNSTIDK